MTIEMKKKLEDEKRRIEAVKPDVGAKLVLVFEKGENCSCVPKNLKLQANLKKINGRTFLFFEEADLKDGFCIPKKLEAHIGLVLYQQKYHFNQEDKSILYYFRFVNGKMNALVAEHISETNEDFIVVKPDNSVVYTDILAWKIGSDIKTIQVGITQVFESGEADDDKFNFYCYRSFFSFGKEQDKVENIDCFNAEIKNLFETRNSSLF